MNVLVTGTAGFIGSLLTEQLLREGHAVRGVDCFTPYYDVTTKRANLSVLTGSEHFRLVEADLAELGGLAVGAFAGGRLARRLAQNRRATAPCSAGSATIESSG